MAIRKQILNVKTLRRAANESVTPWQQPVMSPKWYTLFCCDCALAHQFQFRIWGGDKGQLKPRVQFRVRRADLYTQMKRKHKTEKDHISLLKKGECVRALVDGAMVISLVNGLKRGGTKREQPKKKRKKANG